nr:Uncharacterised protein [Raoultella sp. NCTC 9187]
MADAAEPRRGPQRLALLAGRRRHFFANFAQGVHGGDASGKVFGLALAAACGEQGVMGQPQQIRGLEAGRVEINPLKQMAGKEKRAVTCVHERMLTDLPAALYGQRAGGIQVSNQK